MRSTSALLVLALLATPATSAAQEEAEATEEEGGGGSGGGSGGGAHSRWSIDEPHTGGRPFQLDVYGGFTWWGVGFVSGVRFGIPLMNNGFIESLNNAVYLNFGFDFYFARGVCRTPAVGRGCDWDYGVGLGFPVTLHWEFYFDETWSAFAELGGQFFLHPQYFQRNNQFDVYEAGYWFIGMVGVRLTLNEWFSLVLRVGNPYTAAGVSFLF